MKKLLPIALVFGFFIHLFNSCDSDKQDLRTNNFTAKVDSLINIGSYSLAQLYADSAKESNQDTYNDRPRYLASNIKNLTSSGFQDSVLVTISDNEYKSLISSKTLNGNYLQDDVLNARLGRVLYNRRNDRNYLTRLFKAREAGQTLKQYDRSLAKARHKKKKKVHTKSYASANSYTANSYTAKPVRSYSSSNSGYSSSQCLGTTQKGNQCRRTTRDPSGYCWQHQ